MALIVALSDMKLLSISAPFWALLLGVLASWLADRVEVRRATTVAGT
jgi:benzoate membrane transport protein